jgi:hypothetical protein
MLPFPQLPVPLPNKEWNPYIHRALEILQDISLHTTQTLQSSGNYHQLQFYTSLIATDAVPLLIAIEQEEEQSGKENLERWAQDSAHHFVQMTELKNAAANESTRFIVIPYIT